MSKDEENNPAIARKRRKARLQRKRPLEEEPEAVKSAEAAPDGPERKKPHLTGIKKDARYDPGVEMSREELREWRKEARRVRNRESAAASRRRTRDRISELETQVESLSQKYAAALKRIVELEAAAAASSSVPDASNTSTSGAAQQDSPPMTVGASPSPSHETSRVSPCPSHTSSPSLPPTPVSPTNAPRGVFSLDEMSSEEKDSKLQHLTELISTAVKTKSPGAGATVATPPSLTEDNLSIESTATACDSVSTQDDETGMDEDELGDFLMDALSDEFDCDEDFLVNLCSSDGP